MKWLLAAVGAAALVGASLAGWSAAGKDGASPGGAPAPSTQPPSNQPPAGTGTSKLSTTNTPGVVGLDLRYLDENNKVKTLKVKNFKR